jgi:methanogenic corrinoid protein MtbC1
MNVAAEHYVTRQIQQKIYSAMNQLPVAEFGAKVVVACPPGEEHEIAALAVAYRCRVRGCRVHYLGSNVPISALTNLCGKVNPNLTIISFPVTPADNAAQVIETLALEVGAVSDLAVGGDGALAMRDVFIKFNIEVLEDFAELDRKLDRLMRQSSSQG